MASLGEHITLAQLEQDPYPVLADLRAEEPVAFVPELELWLITRWADVSFVIERPDLFTAATDPSWLNTVLGHNMLGSEGEQHRRLKDALQPTFTPSAMGPWVSDRLPRICDELIDAFAPDGADLLASYAEPIAVRALQDALEWSGTTWQQIGEWTRGVCTGLANFANDPDLAAVAARANEESGVSIRSGVVPQLLGTGLDAEEIVNNVRLCMSGGINEPRDGIALAVWALLTHPEALAACRADRTLWRNACEELFRWIAPVATATRQTTVAVELGGASIPAGALVAAVLSSANRDEARFADADRYDIHRKEGPHLAFSAGAHVCLGAWLGRTTVRVAVAHLFERLPNLRLAGPVEIRGFEFRGPVSLHVSW